MTPADAIERTQSRHAAKTKEFVALTEPLPELDVPLEAFPVPWGEKGAFDALGRDPKQRVRESLLFVAIRVDMAPAAKEVARTVVEVIYQNLVAAMDTELPLFAPVSVQVDATSRFRSPSGRTIDLRATPFAAVDHGVRRPEYFHRSFEGQAPEATQRVSAFARLVHREVEVELTRRGLRVEAWVDSHRAVVVADPHEVELAVRVERERREEATVLNRVLSRLRSAVIGFQSPGDRLGFTALFGAPASSKR